MFLIVFSITENHLFIVLVVNWNIKCFYVVFPFMHVSCHFNYSMVSLLPEEDNTVDDKIVSAFLMAENVET